MDEGHRLFGSSEADPTDDDADDPRAIEEALPAAMERALADLDADSSAPPHFLAQALRVAKLDVPRALRVCANLERFRAGERWALPLRARDVETACLHSRMHVVLPRDRRGRPLLLYDAARLDVGLAPLSEYQKMGSYLMEAMTSAAADQHGGVALVVDLGGEARVGATWALARAFSIADVRRGVLMWRDTFPAKLKRVYITRASGSLRALARAGLALVREKVRKRVLIVDDLAQLHAEIPPESLPRELGGVLDDQYWEDWVEKRRTAELAAERAGPGLPVHAVG